MATFAGNEYNLKFKCAHCGDDGAIIVNPESKDEMIELGYWLRQHSASGGTYENVKITLYCSLCEEEIPSGKEIVNYTGKPICHSCAKDIAKNMLIR